MDQHQWYVIFYLNLTHTMRPYAKRFNEVIRNYVHFLKSVQMNLLFRILSDKTEQAMEKQTKMKKKKFQHKC